MNNILNKTLLVVLIFLSLISFTFKQQSTIDSSEDKAIVEKSVIQWADSTFYFHENYRFEQFRAHYTLDYEMAAMRLDMYKGKLKNLETTKRKGFYKNSEEDYQKEHQELSDKILEIEKGIENLPQKVEFFEILFWSNIKTNHGMTVYYSHLMTLDNEYKVVSHEIKSEIGKKNEETKILYAADVKKKR